MNYNPLNDIMWSGFMSFALGNEEFRTAFTKETGRIAVPASNTSGLAHMIDKATGFYDVDLFMVWATVRLWGYYYAPAQMQDHIDNLREKGKLPWMTDADELPAPDDDTPAALRAPGKAEGMEGR